MVIVPPIEQYRSSYHINTFSSSLVGFVDMNFVNILVPEGVDPSGIRLDGAAVEAEYTSVPCTDTAGSCGSAAQVIIPAGQHMLTHQDPSALFNAIVYSHAFRVGSGYFAGMTQNPIGCKQL